MVKMVFVSMGIRMLVNVEALNMVESVGNVVRHRTVPIIIRKSAGEYIMRWGPAISGECLAHAYQSYLAELATKEGLNTCYWCKKNEFIKHFDLSFYEKTKGSIKYSADEEVLFNYANYKREDFNINIISEIEKRIIKSCVVEDIGGFLTVQGPTKRTSRFQVSYAIPTYDTVEKGIVALDHQFMVRYAPEAETRRPEDFRTPVQAPYYPQIGSALYAWIFNLEVSGIGISSVSGEKVLEDNEILKRKSIAFDALAEMLDNKIFGAKLTRFTPFIDYELILAAVSRDIKFVVSSPVLSLKQFVRETVDRAVKVKETTKAEVRLFMWCKDENIESMVKDEVGGLVNVVEVLRTNSLRDLIKRVKEVSLS